MDGWCVGLFSILHQFYAYLSTVVGIPSSHPSIRRPTSLFLLLSYIHTIHTTQHTHLLYPFLPPKTSRLQYLHLLRCQAEDLLSKFLLSYFCCYLALTLFPIDCIYSAQFFLYPWRTGTSTSRLLTSQ